MRFEFHCRTVFQLELQPPLSYHWKDSQLEVERPTSTLALSGSSKTSGETVSNSYGGPMSGAKVEGVLMRASTIEIVQNYSEKSWTFSVLAGLGLYNPN